MRTVHKYTTGLVRMRYWTGRSGHKDRGVLCFSRGLRLQLRVPAKRLRACERLHDWSPSHQALPCTKVGPPPTLAYLRCIPAVLLFLA